MKLSEGGEYRTFNMLYGKQICPGTLSTTSSAVAQKLPPSLKCYGGQDGGTSLGPLPYFVAERETNSRKIFRAFITIPIFSKKHI